MEAALQRISHVEEELLALTNEAAESPPKLLVNDPLKSGFINVMRHGKKREDLWCTLLPCLGFASYEHEPQSDDEQKTSVTQWLFGGRCILKNATMSQTDTPRRGHGTTLSTCIRLETDHPRRHLEVHQLFFESQAIGVEWLEVILKTRACTAYINACFRLKAQPLIPILTLLINHKQNTLNLRGIFIGRPAIRAIAALGQVVAGGMPSTAATASASESPSSHPLSPSSQQPMPLRRLPAVLNLQHVSLIRIGMGPSDAESVAILLSTACSLRSLVLSANAIGDEGVSIILSALALNDVLELLALDRNYITDAGATRLGHFFEHTRAPLASIDLSENDIARHGANQLLDGIYTNPTLRSSLVNLCLGFNQIGDHTAVVLARLLAEEGGPCVVSTIDLSHAMIGDAGMEWLIWAVSRNKTLKKLDVRGNLSSSSVLAKLVVAGRAAHAEGRGLEIKIGGSDSGWGAAGDMPLRARAMLGNSTTKMVGHESHISRLVLRRHRSEPIRLAGQHIARSYCSLTLQTAPGETDDYDRHTMETSAPQEFGCRSADVQSMSWGEWLTQLHVVTGASFGQLQIVSTVTRQKVCDVAIEMSPPLEHGPNPTQILEKLVAMAISHAGSRFVPLGIHSVNPCQVISDAHAMSALGSEFVDTLDGKYHVRVSEDRQAVVSIKHSLVPPIFLFQQVGLAAHISTPETKRHKRSLAVLTNKLARHNEAETRDVRPSTGFEADRQMEDETNRRGSDGDFARLGSASGLTKKQFESVRDEFLNSKSGRTEIFQSTRFANVPIDQNQSALQAALFKRSRADIEGALAEMERQSYNGRCSMSEKLKEHARRILSDIINLENEVVVVSLADSVDAVESFLGRCGAAGYEGGAVTSAVSKLDALVHEHSTQGGLTEADRWWLQSRQWLTNLLMKRDVQTLHEGLTNIHKHAAHCPSVEALSEVSNAVVRIIEECARLEGKLKSAVGRRHLESIDEALMDAAAFKYSSQALIQSTWQARVALAQYAQSILTQMSRAVDDGNITHLSRLYDLAVTHGISAPRVEATRVLLEECVARVLTMKDLERIDNFRKLMDLSEADVPMSIAAQMIPVVARLERSALGFRPGARPRMRAVRAYLRNLCSRAEESEDDPYPEEALLLDYLQKRKTAHLRRFLSGRGEQTVFLSVRDETDARAWSDALQAHMGSGVDDRAIKLVNDDHAIKLVNNSTMHRWLSSTDNPSGQWVPCTVKLLPGVLAIFHEDRCSMLFLPGGAASVLDRSTLVSTHSLTSRGLPYSVHSVVRVVEGRDLSLCSQDLLAEAQLQLDEQRQDKTLSNLTSTLSQNKGLKAPDYELESRIEKMLESIQDSPCRARPEVMATIEAARSLATKLRQERCIATLRQAIESSDIPLLKETLGQIPEALTEHAVVISARKTADMPAPEQLLHRFSRLVTMDQEGAIASLQSSIIEAKAQLPSVAKRFSELELQHVARLYYSRILEEPEDLENIYDELTSAVRHISNGAGSDATSLLDVFIAAGRLHRCWTATAISYLDCDRLRSAAEFPTASSFRRMDDNRSIGEFKHLLFSTESIRLSLTRPPEYVASKRTYNEHATKAFDVLRKMTCPIEAKGGSERLRHKNSILADNMANSGAVHEASVDLLRMGVGVEYIRDELYAQVIKQLNRNIHRGSRWCTWAMFVLYLRTFSPSADLAPYLRAHVYDTLLPEEEKYLDVPNQTIEDRHFVQNLVTVAKLCIVLLDRCLSSNVPVGASVMVNGRGGGDAVEPPFGLIVNCFKSKAVEFEVTIASYDKPIVLSAPLLTAALPASLLALLHGEIGRFWKGNVVDAWPGTSANQLWHGFDFYISRRPKSPLFLEPQPPFSERVAWDEDARWGRVMVDASGGDGYCVTLRRTAVSRHESFCRDFNPPVLLAATYDTMVVDRKGLWVAWLSTEGNVPFDAVRISLLYGEERLAATRNLHASDHECGLGYLLALQAAIDLPSAKGTKTRTLKAKSRTDRASQLDRLGLFKSSTEAFSVFRSTLSHIEELEQAIGSALNVQRFHYLLQRAFVSYAMIWPFYGARFFEEAVVPRSCRFSDGTDRPVRVAVSTDGVTLLTPQNEQLGKFELLRISSISTSSVAPTIVLLSVGGADLQLKMASIADAKVIVDIVSFNALVAAYSTNFDAPEDVNFGSSLDPLSQGGQLSRYIYDFCPTLPCPPAPPALKKIPLFDVPKVLGPTTPDEARGRAETTEMDVNAYNLSISSSRTKRARRQSMFTTKISESIRRNNEDLSEIETKENDANDAPMPTMNVPTVSVPHEHSGYDRALLLGCVSGVSIQPSKLAVPKLPPKSINGRMRTTRPLGGSARFKRPPILTETRLEALVQPLVADASKDTSTAGEEAEFGEDWWVLASPPFSYGRSGHVDDDENCYGAGFEKRLYLRALKSRLASDPPESITYRYM